MTNIFCSNCPGDITSTPELKNLIDNDADTYFAMDLVINDEDYVLWYQFELSKEVSVRKVLIFNRKDEIGFGTLRLRVGNTKVKTPQGRLQSYKDQKEKLYANARCSKWIKYWNGIQTGKGWNKGEKIDMRCHKNEVGKFVSLEITDRPNGKFGLAEVVIYGRGEKLE